MKTFFSEFFPDTLISIKSLLVINILISFVFNAAVSGAQASGYWIDYSLGQIRYVALNLEMDP